MGDRVGVSSRTNQIGAPEAGTYDFFNSKFETFFNYSLNIIIFYGKYRKRFFRRLDDEDAVSKVRYFFPNCRQKSKFYKPFKKIWFLIKFWDLGENLENGEN